MLDKTYYCYIMASKTWVLYTGVTGDLRRRVFRHKARKYEGFTSRHNCDRLVWFEATDDPVDAIVREKEIKGWLRKRKLELVRQHNPNLEDIAADWFDPGEVEKWQALYAEERLERKRQAH